MFLLIYFVVWIFILIIIFVWFKCVSLWLMNLWNVWCVVWCMVFSMGFGKYVILFVNGDYDFGVEWVVV